MKLNFVRVVFNSGKKFALIPVLPDIICYLPAQCFCSRITIKKEGGVNQEKVLLWYEFGVAQVNYIENEVTIYKIELI